MLGQASSSAVLACLFLFELPVFLRWYAYYRDGSGTQRLRSLKTRNLHEARARALLISEALNSG